MNTAIIYQIRQKHLLIKMLPLTIIMNFLQNCPRNSFLSLCKKPRREKKKFDNLLKNKRVIKLNLNDDADYVAMTDEEKDEKFLEQLNSQSQDQKSNEKSKFKFKLDI